MLYHNCVQDKEVLLGFFHFITVIYNPKWDQDPMLYKHKHKENSKHFPFDVL